MPFIACLGGIPTPVIRAMMSKMVEPNEQGQLLMYVKFSSVRGKGGGVRGFSYIGTLSLNTALQGMVVGGKVARLNVLCTSFNTGLLKRGSEEIWNQTFQVIAK